MPDHSPHSVFTRLKLAALWTATAITIAFVDLFSLYREDVRTQIEQGEIFVFTIGPEFLLGVLIYVLVPTVMIPLSVVLPRIANRPANMALAVLLAITIAAGAIGEWAYYVLGSVVEILFLAGIAVVAAMWRTQDSENPL